jgi:hypothetical protein
MANTSARTMASAFSFEDSKKGKVPVEYAVHPGGAKGAKFSLDKMQETCRKAKNDFRLRGWAGRKLIAAGKPKTKFGQASALLEAMRKQTMYGFDPPNTEFIAAPYAVLCLDAAGEDGGDLCIPLVDCDELTCCFIGILYAAGFDEAFIIAHSYDYSGVPSHVLVGVKIDGVMVKCDPSTDLPFGQTLPSSQEWVINPMDNDPLFLAGKGDYIGVGRPSSGRFGDVTADAYQATVNQLQSAVQTLGDSFYALQAAVLEVENTRQALRPSSPYDPEPAGAAIDLSTLPGGGVWTQSMSALASTLFGLAAPILKAGEDALQGVRQVIVDDTNAGDAYIAATASDLFHMIRVVRGTVTDDVIAITDAAGNVVGGFTSSGAMLPAKSSAAGQDSIQARITAAGNAIVSGLGFSGVGFGIAPIVIVVAIIAAAAVTIVTSIAVYYAVSKLCDMLRSKAEEATSQSLLNCLTAAGSNAQQAKNCKDLAVIITQNRLDMQNARNKANESDPFAGALDSVATTVKWVAIVGIIGVGVYFGAPLIKGAVEDLRAKRAAAGHKGDPK